MANLSKGDLLHRVEEALRIGGWNILYLSNGDHPARYQISRGETTLRVKIYIWNITPGGKNRPAWEWRIQPTGVGQFVPEVGGRTLVLGWREDIEVFAGWDVRKHLAPLGASPSFQIHQDALEKAAVSGFASYLKSNNETAIAFRGDFMGAYIESLAALHDSGAIPEEADLLSRLAEDADEVSEEEIDEEVAEERRFAIHLTKRAVRASDFSRRVLTAYGHRCAMCGVQLRLVEGAHVLPVEHSESTDKTSNGIALCVLHHHAYDAALVAFDGKFKVHMNEDRVAALAAEKLAGGLKAFQQALRPVISLPADKKDYPALKYVTKANVLRGWSI